MHISEWDWVDEDVEHLAKHGVEPTDILAVWLESPKFRRNRRQRAASHQMIGPDRGGRFFTIFVRQDEIVVGRWRAITGRSATDTERTWWEGS